MAYRASTVTSNGASNATTASVTCSANMHAGDTGVLIWASSHGAGVTYTPPAGWSLAAVVGGTNPIINPGVTFRIAVYTKPIVAGDLGATLNFASSAIEKHTLLVFADDQPNGVIDLATANALDATSRAAHTVPNITTTAICAIYELLADKGAPGSATWTPPSGGGTNSPTAIGNIDNSGAGACSAAAGWWQQTSAGATGAGDTWTGSITAAASAAFMMTLAIGPGGNTATASLTLGANGPAAAPATAGASLTLGASGVANLLQGNAAITLGASAPAAARATAGASLTLGASATATTIRLNNWSPRPTGASFVAKVPNGTNVRLYIGTGAGTGVVYTGTQQAPDANKYVRDIVTTGMTFGTRYYYWYTDQPAGMAETTISWQIDGVQYGRCNPMPTVGSAVNFNVGFGGCVTQLNTDGSALADLRVWAPSFFFHLGDQNYSGETSLNTAAHLSAYETQWYGAGSGEYVKLFRDIGSFYACSDHEAGPDNGPSNLTDAPYMAYNLLARQIIFPTDILADVRSPKVGTYYSFDAGRYHFNVPDIRNTDRTTVTSTGTPTDTMLGATQLAWLYSDMEGSTQKFKVMAADTAWSGPTDNAGGVPVKGDWWPAYPVERAAIITEFNTTHPIGHWEYWHCDTHSIGYITAHDNATYGGIPVLCSAPFANISGGRDLSTFTSYFPATASIDARQYVRAALTDSGSIMSRQADGWDAISVASKFTDVTTVVTQTTASLTLGANGAARGAATAGAAITLGASVQASATAAAAIALSASAPSKAPATATAAVTLGATAAPTSSAVAAIVLGASAVQSSAGTAAITLGATGVQSTGASAALTLGASASWSGTSATAAITLSAAAAWVAAAAAALSLSASGGARAPATATAAIVLSALTVNSITGTAQIVLAATGTAGTIQAATGTAAIVLGAQGATAAPSTAGAAITLGATAPAVAATGGTAFVTLGASAATGTGANAAISLAASVAAGSTAAAGAAISLNASSTGGGGSGTAALTLGATATGRAPATGGAAIAITASVSAAGAATAAAQIVLVAGGTAIQPGGGNASITIAAQVSARAPATGGAQIVLNATGAIGSQPATGGAHISLSANARAPLTNVTVVVHHTRGPWVVHYQQTTG